MFVYIHLYLYIDMNIQSILLLIAMLIVQAPGSSPPVSRALPRRGRVHAPHCLACEDCLGVWGLFVACVSVSGVLFSVGVCVCDLLIF